MSFRINRWRPLLGVALALYTVSWFVPVNDSTVFPHPGAKHNLSFGWDALLLSLSPLIDRSWPHSFGDALGQVFSVASFVPLAVAIRQRSRASNERVTQPVLRTA